MRPKVWIPTMLIVLVAAAVTGYAYVNARHAALDPPNDASSQDAADAWDARSVAVPTGTEVAVVLETSLSTRTTHDGDAFVAHVESPVHVGDAVAIPQGAAVRGHVEFAEQPGKASGRGRMQLAFDEVSYGGQSYRLDVLGPVYDSRSGDAAKGALAGGATGAAASWLTRGPQLELPAGGTVRFTLDRDVSVRPARGAA